MSNKAILSELEKLLGAGAITRNAMLKDYTTFRVGGEATAIVHVGNVDELCKVVKLLSEKETEYFILGNGSNLLVSDTGYDGIMLKLVGDFLDISAQGDTITAGAGAMLNLVCKKALDLELGGLEFAYGIPGTVGGAMVMNAGAYDGEMKDVVSAVWIVTGEGELKKLSGEEMEFAYRNSILKRTGYIAVKTEFKLEHRDPSLIEDKMKELIERRVSKQPLEFPSAGSTFKRPEGFFAGKLIMDAGLSGCRVGGASVSAKHCGFIVNDNNATASDINELMKKVTAIVQEKYQVTLEPEVIKIGKFD